MNVYEKEQYHVTNFVKKEEGCESYLITALSDLSEVVFDKQT